MRILSIRFQNLNSLAGTWSIDFTHPAFAQDGLFALTGPTGAGKSTVLDAICLALYGRTPRLGKISKTANEILSRQTGECFAEVTFETQHGRWRCHWSQQRARKQPHGALQTPRHEVSEADSGKVLETRQKDVQARIEEITGLDFDRFTRSMLLAQGGFAAFLQASADERSPILEQITGTEMYSQISIAAHERLREARQQVETLEAQLGALHLLAPEELEAVRAQLAAQQTQEAQLAEAQQQKTALRDALRQLAQLHDEVTRLAAETQQLDAAERAFAPQRAILQRAERALPLVEHSARLDALRQSLDQMEAERPQRLAELARFWAHCQRLHDALHQQRPQFEAAHAQARAALHTQAEAIAQAQAQLQQAKAAGEALLQGQTLAHWQQAREHAQQQLARLEQVEAAREQLQALAEAQTHCQQTARNRAEELAPLTAQIAAQEKLVAAREETLEARRAEHALRQRIASLEEQRAQLAPGEPCPLCGAREHPFVTHAPAPPQDDAIRAAQAELKTAQHEQTKLGERAAALRQECAHLAREGERLAREIATQRERLAALCPPLGLSIEAENAAEAAREVRTKLLAQSIEAARVLREVEAHRQQLDRLHAAQNAAQAAQQQAALAEQQAARQLDEHVAASKAAAAFLAQAGAQLPADLPPPETAAPHAEAPTLADAQLGVQRLCDRLHTLQQEAARHREEIAARQATLAAALHEHGFADEADFRAAHLPAAERDALRQQSAALTETRLRLSERQQQIQQRQDAVAPALRALSPQERRAQLAACEDELAQLAQALRQCNERTGALRQQLSEQARLQTQFDAQRAALDAARRAQHRRERLHQLIGSADGKKYRNFAQGLTFERLIRHANRQLVRLTDRYLLQHSARAPLELDIIDNYQGGEVRPVQNLSGGESFLVSLALALGLADISSQNVRIDSLFLDEGFGALDEDALQTALAALAALQQENRLIGVISHVPALQASIATRIEVQPLRGGRSALRGPGVN